MKQYGSDRVHPQLLDKFITLIVNLHEFKLRPILAILKEYEAIEKKEVIEYKEAIYQKVQSDTQEQKGQKQVPELSVFDDKTKQKPESVPEPTKQQKQDLDALIDDDDDEEDFLDDIPVEFEKKSM